MTTTDQLAAIQARADAATEGPWKWGEETSEWGDCGPNLETVKRGQVYGDGSQGAADLIIGSWGHDANGITVGDANAEFIAHARTDVPALLAMVRERDATILEQQAKLGRVERLAAQLDWRVEQNNRNAASGIYDEGLQLAADAANAIAVMAAANIRAAITATEGAK